MEPEFVRLSACVRTALRHGVGLGLGVAVGRGVAVGAGVGVAVGTGVGVAVGTGVGMGVGTGVGVAVGTGVGVAVGTGVGVAVGTGVGVAVAAGVGVAVGAGVGVGVPRPGVGVAVGAGVGVAVGAGVAQSVTTIFSVVVSPFASRSVIVVEPTDTAATSNHEAGLPFTRGVLRLRAQSTATVAIRVFADEAAMSSAPSSLTPSTTPVVPLQSVSV
jgi:hypothetical protein